MKRFLLYCLLSLALLPASVRAADDTYINNGTVTFPPQIDATNFVNNGTFDFSLNPTLLPFDTSDTENFTNTGTMFGAVGFEFDTAPANTGYRRPATSFRNRLSGTIQGADSFALLTRGPNGPINNSVIEPSYLLVTATNIQNEGTLIAGQGGILRLVGTNINLARSGVEISPLSGVGSVNNVNTNFFLPDLGIYERFWGQTNQVSDSSLIVRNGGALEVSPPSLVDYPLTGFPPGTIRVFGNVQIAVANPFFAAYTNSIGVTNITYTNQNCSPGMISAPLTNIVQAVFVGLPAGAVNSDIRFYPSTNPQNPFQTVSVGISLVTSNVVSATPDASSLYLVDTLASETNRGTYTNFTDAYNQRPQNYLMERLVPLEFFFGTEGNAPFSPDILYKKDFASKIVTNEYAAYSAFVDTIASRPPNIPEGSVTNLPGRAEIHADSLDLSRARFRANGLLDIQARHLVSSSNTVVDCENLNYVLGSTNGNLKIQNLAQDSVVRLMGTNAVWSGLWTNFENMIITNYTTDPVNTNQCTVRADITNVIETRIYAMIYDLSRMVTAVPVVVNAMVTHSTNVVINDNMTVVQSLLIDGQSFTLNGSMTLSNTFFINTHGDVVIISLDDWLGTNAPNLMFFTNNGTLKIPSEAHFGDDTQSPYVAFVNNGAINAFGQTIDSAYVRITGRNNANASISLTAGSGEILGGTLNAATDIQLFGGSLKLNQATLQTGSRLDISVTDSLFDTGGGAGNFFSVQDGFRLLLKPGSGDLLGTSINTIAPAFAEVDHVWAGLDFGLSTAGFNNNAALGVLTLTPGQFEDQFPPLFFFAGQGGNNAIYVDLLDLSKLADYQNELQINSDLVIYYAAARLGFTPPTTNGVPQQPEEFLDGQFGGHLRWVRDFAGPNSSTAVIINGVSVLVNRALRNSLIIDSNGNGIPNGLDPYPFNTPPLVAKLAVTQPPPLTVQLSWNATPNKVYAVQAATNSVSPNWQTIMYYTNSAATNGMVTVRVPMPAGSVHQIYRVGTTAP